MNPRRVFRPNQACPARGQTGKGNIWIHSHKDKRYKCTVCGRTFRTIQGTLFHRLQTDPATVTRAVTLLANGCPVAAIVAAFGFDERTVKSWLLRADNHCEAVHQQLMLARPIELVHL